MKQSKLSQLPTFDTFLHPGIKDYDKRQTQPKLTPEQVVLAQALQESAVRPDGTKPGILSVLIDNMDALNPISGHQDYTRKDVVSWLTEFTKIQARLRIEAALYDMAYVYEIDPNTLEIDKSWMLQPNAIDKHSPISSAIAMANIAHSIVCFTKKGLADGGDFHLKPVSDLKPARDGLLAAYVLTNGILKNDLARCGNLRPSTSVPGQMSRIDLSYEEMQEAFYLAAAAAGVIDEMDKEKIYALFKSIGEGLVDFEEQQKEPSLSR